MKGLSVREIEKLKREFPRASQTKPRKPRVHHEDAEAEALWAWAQTVPLLRDHLYHIPNGGQRGAFEAARLQKMGVRKGVSDYHLPVALGGFIGAWIELKPEKKHRSTVSEEQDNWLLKMNSQGHFVCVCYGFEEAKRDLVWYATQPQTILINVNSALTPWFRAWQEGAPCPRDMMVFDEMYRALRDGSWDATKPSPDKNPIRLPDGGRRK